MLAALPAFAAWLVAAATVAPAALAGAPIAFDLVRAPGAERCPDHDVLSAQVATRLGQAAGPSRVAVADRVTVAIRPSAGGYAATVSALGIDGGTRSLSDASQDCAGLAEALVLTLSMIADGRPLPPPRAVETPPPRAVRPWELGVGAFASTGAVGRVSAGPTLELLCHPWPRIAGGLAALWLPGRSIDEAGGATRFTIVAGIARLCGGPLRYGGRIYPALCAEAGAGGLHGVGEGYVNPRSLWVPWLVGGGSAELALRVHPRVNLRARAGYLFALRTERFTVGDVGPVYDSGHPGFEVALGAFLRIP